MALAVAILVVGLVLLARGGSGQVNARRLQCNRARWRRAGLRRTSAPPPCRAPGSRSAASAASRIGSCADPVLSGKQDCAQEGQPDSRQLQATGLFFQHGDSNQPC